MATIRRNSVFSLWLIVSLALLSIITPAPEAPGNKTETFASALSSIAGDVKLVIWKSHYTLTLYKGDLPVKTYHAVFGRGYQDGDKRMIGDKRTPEGDFYICTMNHSKRFYKFMGLSYPGLKHAELGVQAKLISPAEFASIRKAISERRPPPWDTRLGGAVGIHGKTLDGTVSPRALLSVNWTDGCIALDNADIDEIFSVVSLGTLVTILP
jgi:murein L,D-transpeptidase YafK